MNTNDLPPSAKLAALIEAGRAANPALKLDGRTYFDPQHNCGCALMFAALGSGMSLSAWDDNPFICMSELRKSGFDGELLLIVEDVAWHARSLDEIILSLREGELAKVPA